ncbi:MAG: F0F1 ATP synthase subunit gamma [Bacteroides sp.]|nr:F0F1 ATP synthase subunit gamma [Bacteroides sp.]
MSNLNEIKNRINSVRSTRQITSAMKMVASAKLHKAQALIENMHPYQQKLEEMLESLLAADVRIESPYIEARPAERVAIVLFASNASLCGSFNANVQKMLEHVLQDYALLGRDRLQLFPVGKKAEEAVKRLGYTAEASCRTMADKPSYAAAHELADRLMQAFVAGRVDKVELIYHHFHSAGVQQLTRETYLPLRLSPSGASPSSASLPSASVSAPSEVFHRDYIMEPSREELLTRLLPLVLGQKMYTVLLDAHTSEHAARMMAMQTATDNAADLIQELTRQYNKSRQQAITNELLDIMNG